ncbi:MAG TPA: Mov34/MPN/PAD-1 family protein [Bryobacteraceae bacterium]
MLDDIRLAVVDAFFSLPRGGAEIGGILLGTFEKGRLQILDQKALPCEHASGPSFALSPKDHAALADMLASARGKSQALHPVGWYHSHTRSEIFLSEADLEIHKRYFPEAWQVALVLKPHPFQPTKAGFFFRESNGVIRGSSSYREFTMDPMTVRRVPTAPPIRDPGLVTATVEPEVEPELVPPAPPAAVPPAASPAPTRGPVTLVMPRKSLKLWIGLMAATIGLAICAWGYHTRDLWLPSLTGATSPVVASLGLNTIDANGQLQIRWDPNSPALRNARDGIVIIEDGTTPAAVELDPSHLQAGVFTYTRKGTRVDVAMTINQADGHKVKESTSYLGKLPEARPAADDGTLRNERDELATRAKKLAADLDLEKARNRKLEKSLQDMRKQFQKEQQRKRMGNQSREE